jgi:D-alanine--poly(phosphoribitol) ligase subunit 2
MKIREIVLDILEELSGTSEIKTDPDLDLFGESILDSLDVVQFLVELNERCGITIPASEFDRERWATPRAIVSCVEEWVR